jgi:hypothetical protein
VPRAELEQMFVEALARGEFHQPDHILARSQQAMAEALHAIGKIYLQVKNTGDTNNKVKD